MESLGYTGHWILLSHLNLSKAPSMSHVICFVVRLIHLLRVLETSSLTPANQDGHQLPNTRDLLCFSLSLSVSFSCFFVSSLPLRLLVFPSLSQWVNKDTETIWTVHLAKFARECVRPPHLCMAITITITMDPCPWARECECALVQVKLLDWTLLE